jgi:ADP-ribose pyrophosphatase
MELREKTVDSKRIYDGRVVKLRVDTVELPDGSRTTREVVEHKGAVAIVPLIDSDTVVMVRQFRQPANEVLLEIPAGTLEAGEAPDDCAARELIEETGYRAGTLDKMFKSYLAPGYSSEMLHTYLATSLQKDTVAPEADEFLEIVTIKLDDAVAMIETGEIKDAKTICGVLMAYRRYRCLSPQP